MNTEISKVVAEMRKELNCDPGWYDAPDYGTLTDWADRIERALQQPASADVEREARELLAAEYERDEWPINAAHIRAGNYNSSEDRAIRAITAAIRKQQQEVSRIDAGAIDSGERPADWDAVDEALLHWYGHAVKFSQSERQRFFDSIQKYMRARKQQKAEPVAWMTPESIAHLAKQSGVAKVDAWNCASGTERVPVFTAPQPRIDLSQFKELAMTWADVYDRKPPAPSAYNEGRAVALYECANDLLALIAEQEGK